MYFYKIGYYTEFKSKTESVLCHESKFSKKQLHELIKNAIRVIYPVYNKHDSAQTLSDFWTPVCEYLVEENGFKFHEPRYTTEWTCFGDARLNAETDFFDNNLKDIQKMIRKEYGKV